MNRIIASFRKTSSVVAPAFSISIIILACEKYLIGVELSVTDVFMLTWMFMSIDILATVFLALEGWHKWVSLPYWIRRLICMPFFMAPVVIGVPRIFDMSGTFRVCAVMIALFFAVMYIIVSIVKYYFRKKETDEMYDALLKLKKEIIENE